MHLDVDFQVRQSSNTPCAIDTILARRQLIVIISKDRYRTFTVNGINFPQVGNFLTNLKRRGVKCCTNITPILTIRESDQDPYQALRNFWDMNDKLNPATK